LLRAVRHAMGVDDDRALRRIACEEGWEVVELDRLGHHLKLAGALSAAAVAGALGTAVRQYVGARAGARD
jgi:hypothetical protein